MPLSVFLFLCFLVLLICALLIMCLIKRKFKIFILILSICIVCIGGFYVKTINDNIEDVHMSFVEDSFSGYKTYYLPLPERTMFGFRPTMTYVAYQTKKDIQDILDFYSSLATVDEVKFNSENSVEFIVIYEDMEYEIIVDDKGEYRFFSVECKTD